jgi:hypothetical protein
MSRNVVQCVVIGYLESIANAKQERGYTMAQKELLDKMSIYVPQSKIDKKPVERLIKLGERRDRSVNYLVVEAILQYLDREENKS